MLDILNLRNGMEDNLLLIQQIHLMIQKEGEEQKGFNDVVHAAQQHINSIKEVYHLGITWLRQDIDIALRLIQGLDFFIIKFCWILNIFVSDREKVSKYQDTNDDLRNECEIKIELDDLEKTVSVELTEPPARKCTNETLKTMGTINLLETVCVEPTYPLETVCVEPTDILNIICEESIKIKGQFLTQTC